MHSSTRYRQHSHWLLTLFTLIIIISAFYSELFQAPKNRLESLELYRNPIPQNFLDKVQELHFSNRLGKVELKKQASSPLNWSLTSPRTLKAKDKTVLNILQVLKNMKVRKLYQLDSINVANFSLNSPLAQLELSDGQTKMQLSLGIINPIDNSAYISLGHRKLIYQIDAFDFPLESLALGDFIESKVFSLELAQIKDFKIFNGKPGSYRFFHVKKDGQIWRDSRGRNLANEKWQEFSNKFFGITSLIILDQVEPEIEKNLERYIASPQFSVEITDLNDKVFTYSFSAPIKTIPTLKIAKKQNIVVTASDKAHPFILSKDILDFFKIRESKLRGNDIKKLFY